MDWKRIAKDAKGMQGGEDNGIFCQKCNKDIAPRESYFSAQQAVESYEIEGSKININPQYVEETLVLCRPCAEKSDVGISFSSTLWREEDDTVIVSGFPVPEDGLPKGKKGDYEKIEEIYASVSKDKRGKKEGPKEKKKDYDMEEDFGIVKSHDEHDAPFTEIVPMKSMKDVILPRKTRMNIEIAISHARDGKKTMEEWGLGKSFNYGNTALNFVGLPGTGKTLCAEAIAHELGKKLLVIQPAQLMDMWVGETEKKIVCAFKQAEKLDGVLFFDEADSIVSRRVAVSRSGDSHHNNGINVILQELEKFKGVVIFATNIAINLDPALERRVAMHILFEKPGLKEREQLFRKLTPKRMPLTSDVDFSALSVHEFVGGEIMNVVINAIRIAIYEGAKKVKMEYFERGVEIVLGNRKVMIAGATEFKKESFVS